MGFEPSFTGFERVRREFHYKGLGENGFNGFPLGWNGLEWVRMGFEPSLTGFEWVRGEFHYIGLGESGFHWVRMG